MLFILLVLSLIKIYFGLVAFIFSLPLIGSIVSLAFGMRLVLKIVIALRLTFIISLFLDTAKK